MLTEDDLRKIGEIIDQKVEVRLKPVKKDIKKLNKNQDVMLSMLDREQMMQSRRIKRLEKHLGLPPFE